MAGVNPSRYHPAARHERHKAREFLEVRLFVGVDIGEPIARAAADVVNQLRRRVERQGTRARVAWIPPERMHVTVRFIGEVSDAQARALRSALEPPLELPPFEMAVGGLGMFPTRGRPRVIWAGVTSGFQQLRLVERLVAERLDPVIGSAEDKEYTPHLTLGRVKDATGLTRRICDGVDDVNLGTRTVAAVTLFESRLSSDGPAYLPVLRAALNGAASHRE
jgi:RNA 2',3'-cyclic 3'-phosphodiesterase